MGDSFCRSFSALMLGHAQPRDIVTGRQSTLASGVDVDGLVVRPALHHEGQVELGGLLEVSLRPRRSNLRGRSFIFMSKEAPSTVCSENMPYGRRAATNSQSRVSIDASGCNKLPRCLLTPSCPHDDATIYSYRGPNRPCEFYDPRRLVGSPCVTRAGHTDLDSPARRRRVNLEFRVNLVNLGADY